MAEPFDLIIGAGTAGNAAARALARGGRRVIVAEPDRVGGTCLWRGCMPKKALFQAARAYRAAGRAEQFGTLTSPPSLDWPTVLAWKWHVQETYAGDQDAIMAGYGIEKRAERARFTGPGRVSVGDTELEPAHVIVAVGSTPVLPDLPGIELAGTSEDALRYADLPESLVIVGGGYIAMEFAGIYASFGTAVTMLVRGSRLLEPFDADTVAVAVRELEALGVTIIMGATTEALSGEPGRVMVTYRVADGEHSVITERVLMATGRRPALDDLGLDLAGLEFDDRGRPLLDASLRTSDPRVWIAGDAAGDRMLTPVANEQGASVARSILTGKPSPPDLAVMPSACFTVPELAQVGMTVAEAEATGIAYRIHEGTFDAVGAPIAADERHGLIRLLEGEDGRLVGAHIAGHGASDLIYVLAVAMRGRALVADIAATRAIHPAFTEALSWSAY